MKTILFIASITMAGMLYSQVYKDASMPVEKRIDDLLSKMTLEEKVDMLSGTGFASKPNDRLGIPELKMTDGPVGVRWDRSVAFPASIMLAATFDTSLAYRYGHAIGIEVKAKGRNTILGPCVNINRTPQGGRNFESYGEDPFLASRMAVSYVEGVQDEGVVATTKHFAVNNQETERTTINVNVGKRALYEIYFPAFKAAVQEGKTEAIMCAYNKLDGPYCSENKMLLNDVLKGEWGFDGLVMSDWGAVHSTLGVASYGLDLEMPNGKYLGKESLLPLVKEGKVRVGTIDDKVRRILRVMFRMGFFDGLPSDKPESNAPEQRAVALDVARAGIVLMKNEAAILPLQGKKIKSIAVLGPNALVERTGGGGSALVTPASTLSPLDGVKKMFGKNVLIRYALGARMDGDVPPIDPEYLFQPGDSLNKHGLLGEYFDNMECTGVPKIRRIDNTVNFFWNDDSPAKGIGVDHFSVRWTGIIRPPVTGTYQLTASSDDGIRVSIDGKKVIENWGDHAVEARSADITLEKGKPYTIKIEYYENGGGAIASVGWTKPGENELNDAVAAAQESDLVLIFAGDSHYQESEGFDRKSIDLPKNQIKLIEETAKVNPNVVVVLNAGAQMNMHPWVDHVKALLWAFFPGQEGTQAIMDVLDGRINPSGKLPFTIAKRWEDYPSYGNYPGMDGQVDYAEGIFVGYRYFDTKNIEPEFPFGYGLSYTTFKLSNLLVTPTGDHMYDVTVTVENTGAVTGSDIVQLYVHDKKPALIRPEKELKAFSKVTVAPGESKTVTLKLFPSSFEYYDDVQNKWVRSDNGYTIFVGRSSRDILLTEDVN